MQRLITVTDGRRSPEAGLHLPPRRALRREAALQLQQARALDQKIFELQPNQRGPLLAQQKTLRAAGAEVAARGGRSPTSAATKFRKYERMDEVLFRLAFLLTSVKKEDQAREFFLRLIKDYPNSKYIPDAYLSFAEYYFDKGEMENAPQVLREGRAVPEVERLPLRRLQEGVVLHQPGRLQDRARDLRRRRPHGPGRARSTSPRSSSRPSSKRSEEGHRQGLRRTSAVRTRPGSSSSRPAATSPRR